ncbi:MAG: hypothetical protein QOK48_3450 [Blastocatellia bacterium]|jgi:hypothetical protein|nr:hypothetical protein [Blastocatellia bacterium]
MLKAASELNGLSKLTRNQNTVNAVVLRQTEANTSRLARYLDNIGKVLAGSGEPPVAKDETS